MKMRKRMGRNMDSDYFSWTADRTHRFNIDIRPQRGGTRM